MRSRKPWPGSCVICTTIRSEMTRVPAVTADRSPPASRITGALSPVIAASLTEATPLDDFAVRRDQVTRLDQHARTLGQLRRGNQFPRVRHARQQLRLQVGLGGTQACRLCTPPSLGQRLGEGAEQHGQPQPDDQLDMERHPRSLRALRTAGRSAAARPWRSRAARGSSPIGADPACGTHRRSRARPDRPRTSKSR